jgi:hypothetical protein
MPQVVGLAAFPALVVDAGSDALGRVGAYLHMIASEDLIDAGMGKATGFSLPFSPRE